MGWLKRLFGWNGAEPLGPFKATRVLKRHAQVRKEFSETCMELNKLKKKEAR